MLPLVFAFELPWEQHVTAVGGAYVGAICIFALFIFRWIYQWVSVAWTIVGSSLLAAPCWFLFQLLQLSDAEQSSGKSAMLQVSLFISAPVMAYIARLATALVGNDGNRIEKGLNMNLVTMIPMIVVCFVAGWSANAESFAAAAWFTAAVWLSATYLITVVVRFDVHALDEMDHLSYLSAAAVIGFFLPIGNRHIDVSA